MKIRTKFLAAVLATVMTFGCALSASAWDSKDTTPPAVEFGNSAMPGKTNSDGTATATLTLKSSDFADVTGAKLTVKLPEGMTLVKANVTGNGSWVEDTDYKVDTSAGTITLIDVFNVGDAAKNLSVYLELTVSDNLSGDITVSGEFADGNVDKVYSYNPVTTGKLTLTRTEVSYDTQEDAKSAAKAPDDGYFVPVGGVYTVDSNGKYVYAERPDGGEFDFTKLANSGITVQKCKLPAEGKSVTTFGYTDKAADKSSSKWYEQENGIQFGAYTNQNDGANQFGTLIIMDDYTAFKNAYGKDVTDEKLLKSIVKRYDAVVASKDINEGDALTLKKGDHTITVKKVKQNAHMWKSGANLQYAVRLYNLVTGRSYTGVAYSYNNGTYNFSAEIQTRVNPYAE